jgi:hypothetical protein
MNGGYRTGDEDPAKPRFVFTWNIAINGKVVDTVDAATYGEASVYLATHHPLGARLSAPGAPDIVRVGLSRRRS